MATQAQYDAATKKLLTIAYNTIDAHVPEFFQDQLKKSADEQCASIARQIVDAAERAA